MDRLVAARDPVLAFSITGGGASGAYQAGIIAAILEAMERSRESRLRPFPRLVIGTSAGALNAFGLLLGAVSPQPAAASSEPLIAALWRLIGFKDHGARFVTGGRAWLIAWLTRWWKWLWLRVAVGALVALVAVALVNPVLFGILGGGFGLGEGLAHAIIAKPVWATIIAAVLFLVMIALIVLSFGRAVFANVALQCTLATAARGSLSGRFPTYRELLRVVSKPERRKIAEEIARRWNRTVGAPGFIFTATDVTAKWECLFALASTARCVALAEKGWEVGRIGPVDAGIGSSSAGRLASVRESDLFRCVVASTSIPGVFPSQRIGLERTDACSRVGHDFVDGGVLHNSPMNVAVDAGATHVISIELDPLKEALPLDAPPPQGSQPLIPENVGMTFATLLNMATTEDVYRTIAINQMLRQMPIAKRRIVEVFRIAPVSRRLQTLEFNGHYTSPTRGPDPSLVQWMEQGIADARGSLERPKPFWRATYRAWPP